MTESRTNPLQFDGKKYVPDFRIIPAKMFLKTPDIDFFNPHLGRIQL